MKIIGFVLFRHVVCSFTEGIKLTFLSSNQSPQSAQVLWKACLGKLQLQTTKSNFDTWLRDSSAVSFRESVLLVEVSSSFVAEWLEKRLSNVIQRTLSELASAPLQVQFQVRGTATQEGTLTQTKTPDATLHYAQEAPVSERSRRHSYTFASFVESPSSRLALAASFIATSEPGLRFNPLFIQGSSGFGKTHLLKAISHGATARGFSCLYVSAEAFTNEFISAVQRRDTLAFRQRYLAPDLILLDDIQFLTGKIRTQDALFHLLDELVSLDKQIVVASDRSTGDLSFQEERLYSRLQAGLVARIDPPSAETKMAILERKAASSGASLPEDVMVFFARSLPDNVRVLEGCLARFLALVELDNGPPSLETATLALSAISLPLPGPAHPTRERVLDAVSRAFNQPLKDLKGPGRTASLALARQAAMFLLRDDYGYSLSEIGALLGGRDHSTILHGSSRIAAAISHPGQLADSITAVREDLRSLFSTNLSTPYPANSPPT